MKRRRRRLGAVAALLAFLLTACDGDSYGKEADAGSAATCGYVVEGGDGG
jgi:hypothetical protein